MNRYEELGFFDFEDFVEELNEEELFSVNGGACGAGSSYNPTPHYGGSCAGGGAVTPSYPSSCGGGYAPPSTPPKPYCSGGYPSNNSISVQTSYTKSKQSWVENVGIVTENIQQSCYTDRDNKLTVASFGLFTKKNSVGVDSYLFSGTITLEIDGKKIETKTITAPSGVNLWNTGYDYIGDVKFDTTIPTSGSVKIITDIDMAVNKAGINFASHEIVLR